MIPLPAQLTNRLSTQPVSSETYERIARGIRGWSSFGHWITFRHLVELPVKSILVCGVYHGLDLALIEAAAKEAGKKIELTGVDLFLNEPCADWDETHRARGTWEAAGYEAPPSMEIAAKNAPGATLVQSDAASFMAKTDQRFDVIYLDTSHDEATVRREIAAARRILNPGGLLMGDDYADGVNGATGWGVDRAVQELLPDHVLVFDRIWISR